MEVTRCCAAHILPYKQFVYNCFALSPRRLHAQTLGFAHPGQGDVLQRIQDMQEVIDRWRTIPPRSENSKLRQ